MGIKGRPSLLPFLNYLDDAAKNQCLSGRKAMFFVESDTSHLYIKIDEDESKGRVAKC